MFNHIIDHLIEFSKINILLSSYPIKNVFKSVGTNTFKFGMVNYFVFGLGHKIKNILIPIF